MSKYRVWLRSKPGMYAQYDGYVDVFSPTPEECFKRAVQQLSHTSFKDRQSLDFWHLERAEWLP